jgi:hypothetical protein
VTREVYNLGPNVIEYDCPNLGSTHYIIVGEFDCTAFLDRLSGGIGSGHYVNCRDCATIVSTFANVLGCDLSQSMMGTNSDVFFLNPMLAIGCNTWHPGCTSWDGHYFSWHEVAWKGACTSDDEIFDACLQVDGDADPTSAPHTPLLPINMRFGNPGDGEYRDRLAAPPIENRQCCEPMRNPMRRPVF